MHAGVWEGRVHIFTIRVRTCGRGLHVVCPTSLRSSTSPQSSQPPAGAAMSPILHNNLITSSLPGSDEVYDRSSGTLLRCNVTLCPYATAYPAASGGPTGTRERGGGGGGADLLQPSRQPYGPTAEMKCTCYSLCTAVTHGR